MYQYKSLEDTIAAISTPAGQGGIGIVRLSGPSAVEAAAKIVQLKCDKPLSECQSHRVYYGWAVEPNAGAANDGNIIDEVLIILMRAPHSYTAEDVVEISCHGGMAAVQAVLETALAAGCRLAEPGEFTKRAFLNGRLDLVQAEAVMDIIQAKTNTFLRASQTQLQGELSKQLGQMREELMRIYTMLEAIINFPEDDINAQSRQQISKGIGTQGQKVAALLETSHQGRILKEGLRVVLCGKPNAGKSSLLNALLKIPRAIVTDIAGTTRDVLEEQAHIHGVPLQLVDTAGILEPRDLIEEEAVKRSHLSMDSADIILLILDNSRPWDEVDAMLAGKLKDRQVLAVVNKIDLPSRLERDKIKDNFTCKNIINISVFQPASIIKLEETLLTSIGAQKDLDTHGVLLSNLRHIKALKTAQGHLTEAAELVDQQVPGELVSEEIKQAINQLDSVTGRNIDEDLLGRIFSEFCIGK